MHKAVMNIGTSPLVLASTEQDPEEMGGENEKNRGDQYKLSVFDKAVKVIQPEKIVFLTSNTE